ncbi:flavodoxin family protein [Adlercreutzia sp. ZJ304]|uniref:flavodoxin family protein n=1 Tax=Adlercreutzia sp. ZJ304 TaxID=2709791 RepID=UPI0013EE388C|nr:flavodoxin family protein [Adlercreutzia sp. ZJ304]
MKILVLQGSARKNGRTSALARAFAKGATSAGHDVTVMDVANMNIHGCTGCEWCHTKGNGECVQKDDMARIYPLYDSADMIVIASPIYYGSLTGQMHCAIHRTYALGKPAGCKKMALILDSDANGVYDAAEKVYHGFLQGWYGVEDCGVFEYAGSRASSPESLAELEAFGANLR